MSRRDPFKGLARFEDTDADAALFFGRERDREIIAANLMASRLTVLYGESGVGKSSLLRAGVAHRLRRSPEPLVVVVFDAWQSDPVEGLGRALADAAGIEPAPIAGGHARGLRGRRRRGRLRAPRPGRRVLPLPPARDGAGIVRRGVPRRAVARPGLRASFLVALREETLARLDAFKGRIPNLFGNYLRLEHLDRAGRPGGDPGAGRGRSTGARRADERVEIEPELVDAVLDEVAAGKLDLGQAGRGVVDGGRSANGRIETPYLQLVMQRLWDGGAGGGLADPPRSTTLRELGGAEQIVRDQLRGALDALAPEQQDVAAAVFNHLVTPSGTKIAHGVRDLAEYAHVDEAELAPVLSRLADRADPPSGGRRVRAASATRSTTTCSRTPLSPGSGSTTSTASSSAQREAAARRHRRLRRCARRGGLLVAVDGRRDRVRADAAQRRAVAGEACARPRGHRASPSRSCRAIRSRRCTAPSSAARLEPNVAAESALRKALLAVAGAERPPRRGAGRGGCVIVRTEAGSSRPPRMVASASSTHGHTELLVRFAHGASVRAAAFGPDGRFVFTAGSDGTVKVWGSDDGRLVRTLRHGRAFAGLGAQSRRGSAGRGRRSESDTLACGGRCGGRTPSGRRARSRTPPSIPEGRLVAVAGLDRRALVFSTSSGRLLRRGWTRARP